MGVRQEEAAPATLSAGNNKCLDADEVKAANAADALQPDDELEADAVELRKAVFAILDADPSGDGITYRELKAALKRMHIKKPDKNRLLDVVVAWQASRSIPEQPAAESEAKSESPGGPRALPSCSPTLTPRASCSPVLSPAAPPCTCSTLQEDKDHGDNDVADFVVQLSPRKEPFLCKERKRTVPPVATADNEICKKRARREGVLAPEAEKSRPTLKSLMGMGGP